MTGLSRLKHLVAICILGGLLFPAQAQTNWQSSLSEAPAGPYKAKKPCKLSYSLTWKGSVKAGECSVEFSRNRGRSKAVAVKCNGYTSGLARSVFPYDFNLYSQYNGKTLKPLSYDIWERTRDETKELKGKFSKGLVRVKNKTSPLDSDKVEVRTKSFAYPNIFDLYSSILYIGSQPLANNDRVNLVIYPFDEPYLAKVTVLGRERHKGHNCIKLDLKMNKIKSDLSLKEYEKMKSTTMWITDNQDRVMVELRSEVFIGDVRATLKSSEWY